MHASGAIPLQTASRISTVQDFLLENVPSLSVAAAEECILLA